MANAAKDADAMRNKLNDMAVSKVQKVSGESAFSRFRMLVTMCSTGTLTVVVEQPLRTQSNTC